MRFYNLDGIEEDIRMDYYYVPNSQDEHNLTNYRIEIDLSPTYIVYRARIYANSDLIKEYIGSSDLEARRLADAFVSGLQFKDEQ
jgi:hypothetical protein